ncbi:phosphopantetheinyl transferase [Phaeobacter gallaeciensis]|uniref:Enterobactin synthase component D n=2 Tax=Roseobacteraceae TaxID=2854170 RepID=A0A366XAQ3_9RHOB|nr:MULTISPECIES: 4'-phosphopantetheinyl transferase superfamily protein [Roseobacteraceae]MBT3142628.1 4'-phosphopantetheinyl transferase superfamily protein [Falsiruegeria litorea]MBT8168152.1 4'-phosphopantetheinyl transferase superfamily protein [Falsiruegeria litorea]RBW61610.1 phosphopantetheinyl transferase [Phaeobacter gallaeciensis]
MSDLDHTAALMLASPLLRGKVALASANPTGRYDAYPEEAEALKNAVDKRLRAFSAGRAAARLALKELGAPAIAIPMGEDRAPIWPPMLVGSITHTDTACLAAVGWEGEIRLLGLDLEPDQPLDDDLLPTICTEAERQWLAEQENPGQSAKLIFSIKECVYKAQYRLSQTLFDFDTLEIAVDLENQSFVAHFRQDVAPFASGDAISGRYAIGHGLIVTTVMELV